MKYSINFYSNKKEGQLEEMYYKDYEKQLLFTINSIYFVNINKKKTKKLN